MKNKAPEKEEVICLVQAPKKLTAEGYKQRFILPFLKEKCKDLSRKKS